MGISIVTPAQQQREVIFTKIVQIICSNSAKFHYQIHNYMKVKIMYPYENRRSDRGFKGLASVH